ncbi:MAG: hypothetical protein JXR46_06980 [Calditrichaceae bacterium]|nr:hypothetical protein [Calditrichaceae bacterium]MBN2708773.1 hypothetical protein [Calditrichaceae bacterium]RQV97696.1 MAG: hypothetical protein EH224_01370 [Calditrichota bacterium]
MESLQDLYDAYIQTMPSSGKIKSATTLLIHICKAMNVSSAEEILTQDFAEIPHALNSFYKASSDKGVQDKSMLAEMIGRYGPKDGWEKPYDILLSDSDENLRQFTLYSIESIAETNPDLLIKYIERYMQADDPLFINIAAHLAGKIMCGKHRQKMQEVVEKWLKEGKLSFLEEIINTLKMTIQRKEKLNQHEACQSAYEWLKNQVVHAS